MVAPAPLSARRCAAPPPAPPTGEGVPLEAPPEADKHTKHGFTCVWSKSRPKWMGLHPHLCFEGDARIKAGKKRVKLVSVTTYDDKDGSTTRAAVVDTVLYHFL